MEESVQLWNKLWEDELDMMRSFEVNRILIQFIEQLENGRKNLKIFLPLCGDTYDIKWLADRGHTVVGVEVVEKALESFFKQHNIQCTTEKVPECKGTLYKSMDGKIRLYCCDILDFNSDIEGKYDGIFDAHSMAVLPTELRERFAEVMISLMAPDCRYLLETFHPVDGGEDGHHHGSEHHSHHGTDHHAGHEGDGGHQHGDEHDAHGGEDGCMVTEDEINKGYGAKCNMEKLLERDGQRAYDHLVDDEKHYEMYRNMAPCIQKIQLLTLKR